MTRPSTRAILAMMMQELSDHGWPSEETWAAACRATGRAPPKPLPTGNTVTWLEAAAAKEPRRFDPDA